MLVLSLSLSSAEGANRRIVKATHKLVHCLNYKRHATGPKCSQNGLKSARDDPLNGPKNGQKRSTNQAGMFNSVQKHSNSTYGTTRHIQFRYRLIFVNCRF